MLSKLNSDRIQKLHPTLQAKATKLVELAEAKGIGVLITQGLRTWEEQDALYAKGRTAPGAVVTYAQGGSSYHNFGLAFDIVVLNAVGKADWDTKNPFWAVCGQIGKDLGLVWGGDWSAKKRDMPHFELPGLTLAQCRQLYKKGGLSAVWEALP